jgi:hypothetical protein
MTKSNLHIAEHLRKAAYAIGFCDGSTPGRMYLAPDNIELRPSYSDGFDHGVDYLIDNPGKCPSPNSHKDTAHALVHHANR